MIHAANRNARLMVFGREFVRASDEAEVYAGGDSTVVATDNAHVVATDRATVLAFGRATVVARRRAHVVAHDHVTVLLSGEASCEAYGWGVQVEWPMSPGRTTFIRRDIPDGAPAPPRSNQEPADDDPPTAA
jgi:hypothetical protein